METRAIEQIHMCLNEIWMIKQLIDLKISDDFCSRLLSIYATIRIDDITKIWSHQIPKEVMERHLTDNVKEQYNQELRLVRDKLGAHYQNLGDSDNLFDIVNLFKSINYANIICLIETIFSVESTIEQNHINPHGFQRIEDLNLVRKVLSSLYSDNQAHITNGTLDILGINKGALISTTQGQIKAQHLRSIEKMIMIAYELLKQPYISIEVKHMFKRLYITLVYNYHDNLITRTDISNNAIQFEEGFDILFKKLITKNDNKSMLEKAFNDFERIYNISLIIKKYRNIRNEACAHLDEKSTVEEINQKLDSLNINELNKKYKNMLSMFNYICKNVFCLQMMTLPAHSPIYGVQMIPIVNNENFYGEVPQEEIPQEMSCTEIMRSIRKKSSRYDEAKDTLLKKLMSNNDDTYKEMISELFSRLKVPSISNREMTDIIQSLNMAKRGFPKRLQRTILCMLEDNDIFKNCNGNLLWLLSSICIEDSKIDISVLLDNIIKQHNIISTTLSVLAFLHMTIEKNHSHVVQQNQPHDISETFRNYCDSIKNKKEKCAMMLVLSQHWFYGDEYAQYRTYETIYSDFFFNEMAKALKEYCSSAKMDKKLDRECKLCLNTKHYLLLLSRLTYWETVRNQKNNVFMDMWKNNCFIRKKIDLYEALSVGCLTEQEGNIEYAKEIFDILVEENPISKEAIEERDNFYKRNPAMRD